MSKKYLMFLLLVCIMGMFLVSSVCASDLNETSLSQSEGKLISVEEIDDAQEELGIDEISESEELGVTDLENLSTEYTPTSSSEIQTYINNANNGDTIILDGYYLLNSTITVNKQLNFVGKINATVDGNNAVQLFSVSTSGVTFKNITFKNGKTTGDGGAVYFSGSGGSVVNCSFVNNYARNSGGAVYFSGSGGSVVNCSFVGNSIANSNGGAVYFSRGGSGSVVGCSFISNRGNTLYGDGGAVYFSGGGSVVDSVFDGNCASDGAAVYFYSSQTSVAVVVNCSFVNNSAGNRGGTIYFCRMGSVVGCSFIGNLASGNGGAVYFSAEGSVENSVFDGNCASEGGAVSGGSAINCTFTSNSASTGDGGAVVNSPVSNCVFDNNCASGNGGAMSGFNAYNCSFVNNHANGYGGAIYNAKIVGNYYFKNNSATIGNDSYNVTFVNNSGTFTELNSLINNNDLNIYLSKNYTFISTDYEFIQGIVINRDVTIHGNGYTIDADNYARIFKINSGNVIFKDIIFTNGNSHAVYYFSGGGSVVNCSFVNNFADDGGAVYFSGGGSVVNCSFVNNIAGCDGGAVYFRGNKGSVVGCSFINNSALYDGGAVYFRGNSGSVVGCSFIGNRGIGTSSDGGAIHFWCSGSVVNCSFVGNSIANSNGGAVYFSMESSSVARSVSVVDCTFVNNSAGSSGGAIYANLQGNGFWNITGCTFACSSIMLEVNNYDIFDCIFDEPPVGLKYHYGMSLNVSNLGRFLVASLSNIFGPAGDKVISFNINGIQINETTDSDGLIRIDLSEAGNYSVVASYAGDGINDPVSVNKTIIILPITVIVNDLEIYIGDVGYLVANLYDTQGNLSNENVSFTVGGNEYNITTDLNGLATFKVTDYLTEAGSYTVDVMFAKDGYVASAISNVVIKKYDSSLIAENLNVYIGNEGVLLANLSDSRGPLSNKTITFKIGNDEYNATTDENGMATLKVTDYLTVYGSYQVIVSFAGDEFDKPSSTVVSVNINRYDSVLAVNDLNIFKDENISLVANLSDLRGALSNKIIVFTVDDVDYDVATDANGLAPFEVTKYLGEGRYTVTVKFAGDEFDKPFETIVNVTINKYDSILSANNLVIFKDESDCLIANLSDIRGPLSNKKIIFTVNNVKFENFTDLNGLASFDINSYLDEGTYPVSVSFAGDDFDKPASTNVNVTLKKYDSILTVNDLSIVLGDAGTLTVNLSNMRGPISRQTIRFILPNQQEYTRTTSSQGLASFPITTYLSELGKHTVTVKFEGNDANDPVSINASVIISLYKGNLTVTQNGKYYGDTELTFRLVNSKTDMPIPYAPIKVIFSDGRLVQLSTDSNGLANYPVPFEPGEYTYTASVTSDNVDVNTLSIDDLVINKMVGEIQLSHEDYSKTLMVKLVNPENGDVYRNVNVNLEFSNGEYVEVTTNDLGIAIYDMPFTPDTYWVIASVTGDYKEFEIAELDDMVISDKDNSKIVIYDEVIFDYNKSGRTTFSVTNGRVLEENIVVINHPEAIISLNNNEIVVSNLSAGSYTLRVVTTPNEGYNSVVGTKPIIVNRIYSSVSFDNSIAFDYLGSGSTTVNVVGGSVGNVTIDGNPQGAVINLTDNTITISGINAGTYTLRVTSIPDENHKSIDGTTYIIVRKIDSQVSVSDVAFNYDQSGFANVIVTGGSVNYDKIEVIGQPLANIFFANNMITISNLNVGTYTLSVTSTPDVNHYASTGTAVITVNKIDSKVTLINPIEFDYGGSDFTSVYSEGCSISKDNISVLDESGNKVDAKITYENNVISVSNLAAGVYKLIVISTPDVNHKSVMASRNITVNKVASEIKSYTSIVFNYLDTGSTYITIDGGCLSTEKMEVIDHKEARISFANNQIMVSNLNPGIYLLRVESIPDGNHYADVKFITVTVNKAPLKIQPSSVKTFQLNKGVWKVKVVDSQNKPVSNIKVTLKVYTGSKFKTVSIVTNANGEASFNVKGLSKGTHKIVSSISHNGYSANPATSSIKIIKPKVLKFKVKKRENKKMGSLITFQILDKKTKRGVNGVKVKLMIYTGKKYKAFILKSKKVGKFKGIVGVFTNEFSVGKHKVVVKPISLKYSGSGKSAITIKKSAKKYSKKTTKA